MITDQDVHFHTPHDADQDWAETNYFSFYIPELQLAGGVYVVMRPGVGVCIGEVLVFNRLSTDHLDILYFDSNQHMPVPDDLSDYALANGIEVQAIRPPRDYRIDYVGVDDTELHLDVTGLMEPYDINDGSMCPTATGDQHGEGSGFGSAFAGHFDLTARVTGTLKLYGQTFAIDCVDTMDHSWGPRPVREMRSMAWGHAQFGEDYCCHAIWQFGPFADPSSQFTLVHGYVLEHGTVHGLVSGRMDATRHGRLLTAATMHVVDSRGRQHTISGRTVASDTWSCYTALEVQHVFLEWEEAGRIGHGVIQQTFPVRAMSRARSEDAVARMAEALGVA